MLLVIIAIVGSWAGLIGFQVLMQSIPSRKKKSALIDAIARGDFALVQQIVSEGVPLNFNYWRHVSWTSMGSPLSSAFIKSDPSIATFLIANGASLSPKSPGNEALLTNAVLGDNFHLIDLALAEGHDIHLKPHCRSKPLARAIHHNRVPIARFLVLRGAGKQDLNAGDCRWHRMRGATILFVRELGIDVPKEVLASVEKGERDRGTPPRAL